ncbi:MAG: membrane protein insertase YidC [Bacteroidales bacterium]|jgi:YidC/Oxa1 family membrane protein insertase|nr:membrane protein insertase YidC [Bacteroidales bacterium]
MDKNTIIGLILIFAVVMGFMAYNANQTRKKQEEKAREEILTQAEKVLQDSLAQLQGIDDIAAPKDTAPQAETGTATPPLQAAPHPTLPGQTVLTTAADTESGEYVIETDMARYKIAKKGGYIKYVELKKANRYTPKGAPKQPLVLFDGEQNSLSLQFALKDQTPIETADLLFEADMDTLIIAGKETRQLSLRVYAHKEPAASTPDTAQPAASENAYMEFLSTFKGDDYKLDFTVNFVNMKSCLYPASSCRMTWAADLINVEKNYEYERNATTIFYMDNLEKVDNLNETKNEKKDFTSPIKWISCKQQFFTATLIADSANFTTASLAIEVPDNGEKTLLKRCYAELEMPVKNQDNNSFGMSFYFGPNQYKLLKEYHLNLERQLPLGWGFFLLQWINRYVIIPVFNWLEHYGLSYGIIILILTILLKTILFPIAYKQYLSGARMRLLKPDMDEINARYPKQEDALKKQQATMALYKRAGVSPMSGCLPMLLQFPILIAMFRFFPASYELRQQSFLWAEDLSTYDSVLNLSFNIPFYGDHVSLFTLLMTIATLIYSRLNNKQMAAGSGDQQKMMKIMMYIMPVLFLPMFNSFSSGLTYYYLLVNLITFVQMGIFKFTVDEHKLRKKMQTVMSKSVKKSKWQIRMEEMMKQQKQMQRKK